MRPELEAATVLELGARGRTGAVSFVLAGRTCVQGRRGVLWNEWVLRCEDQRLMFLVESILGSELTLYEESSLLPSFEGFDVGRPIDTGFTVTERGEATRLDQWGEVETAPRRYRYVDLTSRSGALATIDFGDAPGTPPRAFVGRRVTLDELGLTAIRALAPRFARVEELSRPSAVEIWLDIGDVGEIDGTRWRVIGMVSRRSRDTAGDESTWEEYVLFAPERGLRWLVVADGHWSFVEAIDPGRPVADVMEKAVALDGVIYELLSESRSRIEWAAGELPWGIAVGETSEVTEFIHPPWLVTQERSTDEVSWSRSVHLTPDVVAKAFGKRQLPKPIGRSPLSRS